MTSEIRMARYIPIPYMVKRSSRLAKTQIVLTFKPVTYVSAFARSEMFSVVMVMNASSSVIDPVRIPTGT
jgi:hypothetical protein